MDDKDVKESRLVELVIGRVAAATGLMIGVVNLAGMPTVVVAVGDVLTSSGVTVDVSGSASFASGGIVEKRAALGLGGNAERGVAVMGVVILDDGDTGAVLGGVLGGVCGVDGCDLESFFGDCGDFGVSVLGAFDAREGDGVVGDDTADVMEADEDGDVGDDFGLITTTSPAPRST